MLSFLFVLLLKGLFARAELAPSQGCAFIGARNVPIACTSLLRTDAVATVIVLPGYSESLRKYSELAQDLYAQKFSVYLMDHRGQGESGRLSPDAKMASIDDFSLLADDVKRLLDTRVATTTPVFLLGHSFGGAVAASFVIRYPKVVSGVILSAPMLGLNLGRIPRWLADVILFTSSHLGFEMSYLQSPSDPVDSAFAGNRLTHDKTRYDAWTQILKSQPQTQIWGRSWRWLAQSLLGADLIARGAKTVHVDTLILQAADDDYVLSDPQNNFCAANANCRLVRFDDAFHEILQEADPVRNRALREITQFVSDRARAPR